jgi:RNA polymerase sigma-70 factor (ECF subfamily)
VTHVELYFPRQHNGSHDDRELADLAARARSGSSAAFDDLAARIRGRVVGWARAITGDEDEAEDVAQLVLLRLHDHVAEFEGRSRFTSWVYRIVRNVALNRARGDRRRAAILEVHGAELDRFDEAAEDHTELRALAENSLGALTAQQREVFVAVDLEGRRVIDVAARMKMSPVAARGCLLRARRAIRLAILTADPTVLEDYGK